MCALPTAGMPCRLPLPVPSALFPTATGGRRDTGATIDSGHADNPPSALTGGTLTHRRLACPTGHLTRGRRGVQKGAVDRRARTGVSPAPLKVFYDRLCLLHCWGEVRGAIRLPRAVGVHRVRRAEKHEQSSYHEEMEPMSHRLLLRHTLPRGTHGVRECTACAVYKNKHPQGGWVFPREAASATLETGLPYWREAGSCCTILPRHVPYRGHAAFWSTTLYPSRSSNVCPCTSP
jgi:hypothetical protein